MVNNKELLERIGGLVLFDEPMSNHTTFHVGGPADILVIPKNIDDVKCCIAHAIVNRLPFHFIGNGSKLLVSDYGIRGMVIKFGHPLDSVTVSGEHITAEAGTSMSKIITIAKNNNLTGIEFAYGIPGTLGGAVVMNAGTNLGSMSKIVEKVTVLSPEDGSLHTLSKEDCCFGYRESAISKRGMAILEVEMRLKKDDNKKIEDLIVNLRERRNRIQPAEKYSAGSVFKNPQGMPAGKLIESVGLKGFRKGGAKISEVHANFIINTDNASAADVFFLIKLSQKRVQDLFGVLLQPEIICLGKFE